MIRRFAFFGSVLRDDFGPTSDVDVEIVWNTVQIDLPPLVGLLEEALAEPFDRP